MARTGRRRAPAFTLVELLVVIVIVLLVSAVALPTVLPALSHRQVSEAARLLQAQLVQTRDTAIRFDAPRGMRLLPDPTYANSPTILASNRMIPLEPGPEYSNGMVTVWPAMFATNGTVQPWAYSLANYFPPLYPAGQGIGGPANSVYPIHPPGGAGNPTAGQVLMIEQAPLQANDASKFFNAPTSWFWNVRVGDKIRIGQTGQTYTVVGPCKVNPFTGGGNPELFVNNGDPGDTNAYLQRQYTGQGGTAAPTPVLQTVSVEFLLVVNGIDDDGDGYTDEGWDGVDNNGGYNYNAIIDDQGTTGAGGTPTEWEVETFRGTMAGFGSPVPLAVAYDTTNTAFMPAPSSYTIFRRPVPTQAAREVLLPNNVVIDMTSWNFTSERSRLPVDPFSKYVDIMLLPSGQVLPNTAYSTPTSFGMSASFYHFWLSERQDVHEMSDLWGMAGTPPAPAPNPDAGSTPPLTFRLPMPQDAYNAYIASGKTFTTTPPVALTGERMLVTLFARTGQVITNSVEFFDVKNTDTPFLDSQLGQREGK